MSKIRYQHTDPVVYYTAAKALTESPDTLTKGVNFINLAERMVYESTPYGSSRPAAPHLNWEDPTPRHHRIELIQRRLKSSWPQAERALRCFSALEFDATTANEYIAAWRFDGSEKLEGNIVSLEEIAAAMADLAWEPMPETLPAEAIWPTIGEYTLRGVVYTEEWVAEDEPTGEAVSISFMGTERLQIGNEYDAPDLDWAVDLNPEEVAGDEDEDGSCSVLLDTYSYHPVADPAEDAEDDWLTHQPVSYRTLLQTVRDCKTFSDLKGIMQAVRATTWESYRATAREAGISERGISALTSLITGRVKPRNTTGIPESWMRWKFRLNDQQLTTVINYWMTTIPPMTKPQASLFWSYYRIGKKQLGGEMIRHDQISPRSVAARTIDKIIAIDDARELSKVGRKLMAWSRDEIKAAPMPKSHWALIWATYKRHRAYLKGDPVNEAAKIEFLKNLRYA
jgi:hypothetical protein